MLVNTTNLKGRGVTKCLQEISGQKQTSVYFKAQGKNRTLVLGGITICDIKSIVLVQVHDMP
jgi:hypothetical protein